MGTSEHQKPALVRLLEAVAAILDLDGPGIAHLTLEFHDGHLRRWGTSDPGNGATELARYDQRAEALVSRLAL
jgi:hypothetical protein